MSGKQFIKVLAILHWFQLLSINIDSGRLWKLWLSHFCNIALGNTDGINFWYLFCSCSMHY